MLSPKRVKYRKRHKGRMRGTANRGNRVSFGEFGLQAAEGKGKGNPEGWVAVVKPGRMMFEMEGVSREIAERAMTLASAKLPIKTRFVVREEDLGG